LLLKTSPSCLQNLHCLLCIVSATATPASLSTQHSSSCSCTLLLPSVCFLLSLRPCYRPFPCCPLSLLLHCCPLSSTSWLHSLLCCPAGHSFLSRGPRALHCQHASYILVS
jgi:hypothetical protein